MFDVTADRRNHRVTLVMDAEAASDLADAMDHTWPYPDLAWEDAAAIRTAVDTITAPDDDEYRLGIRLVVIDEGATS